MKRIRKIIIICSVCICMMLLASCDTQQIEEKKLKDCDFTVMKDEAPKELVEIIEGKKEEPFQLTYADAGELYIVVGYGKQVGGGYSISVEELYETEHSIYISTKLTGPEKEEKTKGNSYPYAIIKMEYIEKEVVFL